MSKEKEKAGNPFLFHPLPKLQFFLPQSLHIFFSFFHHLKFYMHNTKIISSDTLEEKWNFTSLSLESGKTFS